MRRYFKQPTTADEESLRKLLSQTRDAQNKYLDIRCALVRLIKSSKPNLPPGLLINFHEMQFVDGVARLIIPGANQRRILLEQKETKDTNRSELQLRLRRRDPVAVATAICLLAIPWLEGASHVREYSSA